jgi:hypothetical protein
LVGIGEHKRFKKNIRKLVLMKQSNTSSKQNDRILKKIYDVLIRIEKHLLKNELKEKKPKKQLLND